MLITSYQSSGTAGSLLRGEPLKTDPGFFPAEWENAYNWMRHQMVLRCGPSPFKSARLFWGWAFWHAPDENLAFQKPDCSLRRLGLRLDPKLVLYSDFQAWHIVLNGQFLALNEVEASRHEAVASAAALVRSDDCKAIQVKASPSKEIIESWQRIFVPSSLDEDYWGSPESRVYQVCFWQPKPEAIIKCESSAYFDETTTVQSERPIQVDTPRKEQTMRSLEQ